MPYHTEFRADVQAFLGRYAVSVGGGMTNNAHGGGNVQQLLAGNGFVMGGRKSEVSLAAPLVYAYFALSVAGGHRDKLPFSKDTLSVTLGNDDGLGTCVPVYLIPYAGGRAMGVRLPSQVTDGMAEAWAMTATQNGCTVEISGDRSSPWASHTNVRDALAANRQTKMSTRLGKLQARYLAALGVGPVAPQDDPRLNRTQFGFYDHTGPNPAPNVGHGYSQHVSGVVGNLDNRTRAVHHELKGGRVETGLTTHTRFYFTPTQDTVQSLSNVANPPNALVVGHRILGQWTFYYQEYASMNFHVREVRKFGPKLRTHDAWIQNTAGTGNRRFGVDVVLSHGEIWPNVVSHDEAFG